MSDSSITELPLLSLEQLFDTYNTMHAPNPHFGMDLFSEAYGEKDILLLHKNGSGSSGVPLRCGYHIMILCLCGGSKRSINQHEYTISAHSLQLLHEGVMISFRDHTPDAEFYILMFNKHFLQSINIDEKTLAELFQFHENNPSDVILDANNYQEVYGLYHHLNREFKEQNSGYRELVGLSVIQLLLYLKRAKLALPKEQNQSRSQQIHRDFLTLIEKHYTTTRSVQAYATLLGVMAKHLSQTISSVTGNSALSFIHLRIMKELQYLLCHSDLSIKVIADLLAFENSSELGRFFKRYEGISPKMYRLKVKL